MPPKKINEIRLYEPMYQVEINVLIGGTADDLIKLIRKRHKDAPLYSWDKKFEWGEDANTTDGYQFHVNALLGQGEKFYLWFHEPTPFLAFHEIYHLAGDILFTRGIEYNYGSEECYAYLGGWIFDKFYSWVGGKLKL